MVLSRRVQASKISATIAIMNRAKDLQRQGVDVLSFAAGEPDFDTPKAVKDAAIKALLAGQTKYMPTMGDMETRGVIAEKVTRDNGIPNVTAEHVGISCGGKHALYTAMQCLFDPPPTAEQAQECILPVPSWVSYGPLAEVAGARIVEVPTAAAAQFKMSPEQLRGTITPNSRLLLLNSPSNPCGTMYSEAELRALAAVVADAAANIAPNLVILSDEIYEKIVYGGPPPPLPHFSIGAAPEVAERTITVNGLSKAYAMTGWRVGYTTTSGEWGLKFMKAMAGMQGQMTTNITSFCYPAIRTALRECGADVERMRDAFAKRAALIHGRMTRIKGFVCTRPTGAFYMFPDISSLYGKRSAEEKPINTAMEFCEALLNEARVAAVPGDEFRGCGRNHVRFSFACSEEQIEKGCERLGAFVSGLK